jgi:hypothetical protein
MSIKERGKEREREREEKGRDTQGHLNQEIPSPWQQTQT